MDLNKRAIGKTTRIALIIAILLIAGFGYFAFVGVPKERETKLVSAKIAISKSIGSLPISVGVEKGFFKQQGINVTLVQFPIIANGINALLAGDIDFAYNTYTTMIALASSRGVYNKVIAPLSADGTYKGVKYAQDFLIVRKDINGIQDLKGKTLAAIASGAFDFISAKAQIRQGGLDPNKDMNWIYLSPFNMPAAFVSGQIQGAVVPEPYATEIIERGLGKILLNSNFAIRDEIIPIILVVATEEYVQKNPEVARKISIAIAQSNEWINNNPRDAQDLLAAFAGIDRATIAKIWERNQQGIFKPYPDGWTDWKVLEPITKMMVDEGIIDKPVDTKRFVTLPWFTP